MCLDVCVESEAFGNLSESVWLSATCVGLGLFRLQGFRV